MPEAKRIDLILASASTARRTMLTAAGLAFRIITADIDEDATRHKLRQDGTACDPSRIAELLACAKAEQVSRQHPAALVIGADQVLALGSEIFLKPSGISDARATLLRLRGKTHHLHSAAALAKADRLLWTGVDTAELTMRRFSMAFLDAYLARAGAGICKSVGAYELEGMGIQLFEHVAGDYFTVLGLPLLPLLAELRARGIVMA